MVIKNFKFQGVASSYYSRYHYDNNFEDNTVEISPSIRFSWTSGQWGPVRQQNLTASIFRKTPNILVLKILWFWYQKTCCCLSQ